MIQNSVDIVNKKQKSIFSQILILAGGLLLFIESTAFRITGSIVLLFGVFAILSKTGIFLDFEQHRYRQYIRFLNLDMGKWESLPEINYIAIVRVRMSRLKFRPSEVSFRQVDDSFNVAYDVNLIFSNSTRRYQKVFNGDLKDAKGLTVSLAKKLNLKIYDSSTSIKKWVEMKDFDSFL